MEQRLIDVNKQEEPAVDLDVTNYAERGLLSIVAINSTQTDELGLPDSTLGGQYLQNTLHLLHWK